MQLYYITSMQYPSPYANRLQVLKMSEAFSRVVPVRLFVQRIDDMSSQELCQEFKITSPFDITVVSEPKLKPRSMWFAWKMRSFVKQAPADTIFYVREPRVALWMVVMSKRFRKQFFYESHSLHRFSKTLYRFIFLFAKGLIVTNQIKKDITMGWGFSDEFVLVESNAIDEARFDLQKTKLQARDDLELPQDKKIILYIGAFTEDRGTDTFLQAAAHSTDESILYIAMGGNEKDTLQMKEKFASDSIIIGGRVAYELVPTYMAAADILVAPFSGKHEVSIAQGSPLKIPEYMYATRPILGTDTPMMRSWLDETVAILIKPDDPVELESAIRRMLSEYTTMEGLAEAAHTRVRHFTWNARAERIVAFIKQRLGE